MSARSESEPFKAVEESLAGARRVKGIDEWPLLGEYDALMLTHAVFARLRQFGPLETLTAIYGEGSWPAGGTAETPSSPDSTIEGL